MQRAKTLNTCASWCSPVISWCINPIDYRYLYHKPWLIYKPTHHVSNPEVTLRSFWISSSVSAIIPFRNWSSKDLSRPKPQRSAICGHCCSAHGPSGDPEISVDASWLRHHAVASHVVAARWGWFPVVLKTWRISLSTYFHPILVPPRFFGEPRPPDCRTDPHWRQDFCPWAPPHVTKPPVVGTGRWCNGSWISRQILRPWTAEGAVQCTWRPFTAMLRSFKRSQRWLIWIIGMWTAAAPYTKQPLEVTWQLWSCWQLEMPLLMPWVRPPCTMRLWEATVRSWRCYYGAVQRSMLETNRGEVHCTPVPKGWVTVTPFPRCWFLWRRPHPHWGIKTWKLWPCCWIWRRTWKQKTTMVKLLMIWPAVRSTGKWQRCWGKRH